MRNQQDGDIYVYGSLSVVRALLTAQLVDELMLIKPITLWWWQDLVPG
jgi:dihydrofolate reductase